MFKIIIVLFFVEMASTLNVIAPFVSQVNSVMKPITAENSDSIEQPKFNSPGQTDANFDDDPKEKVIALSSATTKPMNTTPIPSDSVLMTTQTPTTLNPDQPKAAN